MSAVPKVILARPPSQSEPLEAVERTPGEWRASGRGIFAGDVLVAVTSHPRDIEENPSGKFSTYEQSMADAQFIARAVNCHAGLLAALINLVPGDFDQHPADFMPEWHAARSVIAKAGAGR